MNAQPTPQTNWKFILGTGGTALVLGVLFINLFWNPLETLKRKYNFVANEEEKQQSEWRSFVKEKRRLDRDRLLGMPKNIEQANSDYMKYLRKLLTASGLKVEDLQPAGVDTRQSSTGKKAGHIPLSFTVRAEGDWPSLVKMSEKFQRTPLLHRIKACTIEEAKSGSDGAVLGKLTAHLTIEALMVGRNQRRPDDLWGLDANLLAADLISGLCGQPAGWALVLRGQALLVPEMPDRDYGRLALVDPFMPPLLWAALEKQKKKLDDDKNRPLAKKGRPRPPAEVRLTAISTIEGEQKPLGWLVVYTEPTKDVKLRHNKPFEVVDAYIKGKVLRIDPTDLYIQVGKDIFAVHVGETLAEAMRRPLSPPQLRKLGLLSVPPTNSVGTPVSTPEAERLHVASPVGGTP
jgi:hypothetical protein